jgi:transcriptional regulator with XRE-family HTH domain
MATRERLADRGTRTAMQLLVAVGAEIRNARLGAGLSQRAVAKSARVSQPVLSRIERAQARQASIETLARVLAVVGLRLSLKAYPDGDAVRDAPQPPA